MAGPVTLTHLTEVRPLPSQLVGTGINNTCCYYREKPLSRRLGPW